MTKIRHKLTRKLLEVKRNLLEENRVSTDAGVDKDFLNRIHKNIEGKNLSMYE